MSWPKDEALIAIKAIRTAHQGGNAIGPACPRGCFHSDERLAGMIETIYAGEVLPWDDDYQRIEYIEEHGGSRDESYLLLVMSQLTDSDGYNKRFFPQNTLVSICHMNKAEMVDAIYRLHNRGVITYRKGYKGKASEYWLHQHPVDRRHEDKYETNADRKEKKTKSKE